MSTEKNERKNERVLNMRFLKHCSSGQMLRMHKEIFTEKQEAL
jgi:hypothetical protein